MTQRPHTARPHDWVQRLAAFVQTSARQPFAWGSNDCFSFAARWVAELTGRDVKAGQDDVEYDSAVGAVRRVKRYGGMLALGTAAFGEPLAQPLFAQRGDILLIECIGAGFETFDGHAFVVLDQAAMLGPGEHGLLALPFNPEAVVAAWAV